MAAMDLMRWRLRPPAHVAADSEVMTGLQQNVLQAFIQLLLAAGDLQTSRELLAVLRPSTRPAESNALKEIAEGLDRNSLRLLVRALPQEANEDRTALLSGLAEGLQWRAFDSPDVDFCAAAKAEARADLLAEWRNAEYPCAGH